MTVAMDCRRCLIERRYDGKSSLKSASIPTGLRCWLEFATAYRRIRIRRHSSRRGFSAFIAHVDALPGHDASLLKPGLQSLPRKRPPGCRFEIPLKCRRSFSIAEGNRGVNDPWTVSCGGLDFTLVVFREPGFEVRCHSDVVMVGLMLGLQDVDEGEHHHCPLPWRGVMLHSAFACGYGVTLSGG